MFPIDTISPQYFEERAAAADNQRAASIQRLAKQQQAAALHSALYPRPQPQSKTTTPSASRSHPTSYPQQNLSPTRPALPHMTSSVFGGFLSGFVNKSTAGSGRSSAAATPVGSPLVEKTEAEAMGSHEAAVAAERKRDADICALPSWH